MSVSGLTPGLLQGFMGPLWPLRAFDLNNARTGWGMVHLFAGN